MINLFNINKYKGHPEAVIISCFFNPQNSPYRLKAFNHFYKSIKHLNHAIVECVIGDAKPQLPENKNITRVYTQNLLWHKEALLNLIVSKLPKQFKYVFWVDADVIFTNKNWLVESVSQLQNHCYILQPFEYCLHLDKDELRPGFDYGWAKETKTLNDPTLRYKQMWRSFCANFCYSSSLAADKNYDKHGHVGFAWGARRDILEKVPLYDKALIGGADHIIAHAAAGHIPHCCIEKSFTDNLQEVNEWSEKFFNVVNGKIGYVKGDLFHIWHGDINKRDYLKRIQDFTPTSKKINNKDKNGLYITDSHQDEAYIKNYFRQREVNGDDGFLESMAIGYMTDSTIMGTALGGNPLGAMIGDMMNNSDEQSRSSVSQPDTTMQNDSTSTTNESSTFS